MSDDIEVYAPGNEVCEDLDCLIKASASKRPTLDYNHLASRYNKAKVGSILVMGDATTRVNNLNRILGLRGLAKEEDYILRRPRENTNGEQIPVNERKVLIKKLTEKELAVK